MHTRTQRIDKPLKEHGTASIQRVRALVGITLKPMRCASASQTWANDKQSYEL